MISYDLSQFLLIGVNSHSVPKLNKWCVSYSQHQVKNELLKQPNDFEMMDFLKRNFRKLIGGKGSAAPTIASLKDTSIPMGPKKKDKYNTLPDKMDQ